jgi:phosphatidate cytidylyltransferase
VLALTVRGQWELTQLFEPERGYRAIRTLAIIGGAALILDAWYLAAHHWTWILLAGTMLVLVAMLFSDNDRRTVGIVGGAALSWLYVAIPLAHLLWLRGEPGMGATLAEGAWLVGAFWLLVWTFDTVAYLAGSAWGRHKLAPSISPGKSWEGTISGFLAVAIVGGLIAQLAPRLGWTAMLGLSLGLIIGVGAVVGDLIESGLKRGAGIKNAGSLLQGHGGVLDRFDSSLIAAPLFYYAVLLLRAAPTTG